VSPDRETAAEARLRAMARDTDARLRQLARERHQADADFRRSVRWVAGALLVACICAGLAVWGLR
jgi:hypothetical protein